MNAIEIKNLCKNYKEKQALAGLDMTVPVGSIYGFIGENGSGKSTTEKIICGLIHPSSGEVKLYGRNYTDPDVRAKMGVLIEAPGCFGGLTVWNNLIIQATNLSIKNKEEAVRKVLTLVRMEGSASNKYKNCSLGMKQRIGIAMALLGEPKLLVLDEPINGLDADGMRIMREVLKDIAKEGVTILISSHVLTELEKVATHYGIIRGGKMLVEMTAQQLKESCPTYLAIRCKDMLKAEELLKAKYHKITKDEEKDYLRIYDTTTPEEVVEYLFSKGILTTELVRDKIGLEEYYINLLSQKEVK